MTLDNCPCVSGDENSFDGKTLAELAAEGLTDLEAQQARGFQEDGELATREWFRRNSEGAP